MARRDDEGQEWTREQVRAVAIAIVAKLAGVPAETVYPDTRLGDGGLGWDDWHKLSLVKPVRSRLHESLSHAVLKNDVATVGQLISYVWSLMEEI